MTLTLTQVAAPTLLGWDAPADPGATMPRYDTLRSTDPADFFGPAICIDSDGTDRFSDDSDTPETGQTFFYLIRVENGCPGAGAMGQNSVGVPRSGQACP